MEKACYPHRNILPFILSGHRIKSQVDEMAGVVVYAAGIVAAGGGYRSPHPGYWAGNALECNIMSRRVFCLCFVVPIPINP